MKNYLILFFFLIIISCNRDKISVVSDNENGIKTDLESTNLEKKQKLNNFLVENIEDSIEVSNQEGPKFYLPIKESFVKNEIYKFLENIPEWYMLPQIKKIKYIDARNENDTICCSDIKEKSIYKSVKEIFDFKGYRFRLPDVFNYKVYMVCGLPFPQERNMVYKEVFIDSSCCQLKINYDFGYFILYNEKNQQAIVIDIYNSRGNSDGSSNRFFSINENYEITLKETYYYFSDVDKDGNDIIENETKQISIIRILQSGDIEIEYPKRIDFTNEGKEIIINPRTIIYGSDGKIKSITIQK